MNVSDTERAATLLESRGFQIVPTDAEADIVLINTCSVREKAEHKLYTRVGIERHKERKPIVGVMGCVAQLEGETLFKKAPGIDFVLGTRAVGRVDQAIFDVIDKRVQMLDLGEREFDYDWSVSRTQTHSPYVAFVPIIEGCNKFCTYCIVPFSRGRERSLAADKIVAETRRLMENGVREVHLIGQNVNSYRPRESAGLEGFAGATPFVKLLRAVAATGIERVKFTTSFPRDFHPDIVKAIDEHENLCNWVHLPVQSGSDRVLRAMRRGHTAESYKKRIDAIKNSSRNISLTTDIIVGFPGETERDFQDTMRLVEYCQYDSAYYFKYSARPGTPAAAIADDISEDIKSLRFQRLDKLQREIQARIFAGYIGRTLDVLAEGESSWGGELTGHSTCHKVVNFKGEKELLGRSVSVKVIEAKNNSLYGILVK